MLSIYSISLGCPKNRVDTERTLGALGPSKPAASPEKADLVFINTCGFIGPAVEESVRTILETLDRIGKKSKVKRPLAVAAGCLVGRYGAEALAPDLPELDLILDNKNLEDWGRIIGERLGLANTVEGRLLSTGPSYAWLKISDGCRHACSFCTIPSIRGKLRSTAPERLETEAKQLVDSGVKELVLAAQDLTAYGKDGKKYDLRNLLDRLFTLSGLERLRLMYMYPAGVTDDLLRFLQEAGKPFVPYFDVPVQHAAKNVLSRMGRPFADNPYKVVDRIRSFFPEAALRTSIITGFPGETEADFKELEEYVERVRFHHLGVFAYKAEEGTPAAEMADQIPDAEKEWRRDSLMARQADISAEILSECQGERMEVLVDAPHEEWPGLHVGRVWFQAPECDGITYVSGPGVRPGVSVEADIMESSDYDLTALTDSDN